MKNTITLRRAGPAFLAAVTAAAACSTSIFLLDGPPPVATTAIIFGMSWLIALGGGILPFALGIRLANRLGIRNWAFFTGGGTAAALLVFGLILGADAYACEDSDDESAFAFVLFAASGACAGTACWYVLRRQERLQTSVRMS
ncbi:hypothetical protein ABT364_23760 [Massilia sp. SR12]